MNYIIVWVCSMYSRVIKIPERWCIRNSWTRNFQPDNASPERRKEKIKRTIIGLASSSQKLSRELFIVATSVRKGKEKKKKRRELARFSCPLLPSLSRSGGCRRWLDSGACARRNAWQPTVSGGTAVRAPTFLPWLFEGPPGKWPKRTVRRSSLRKHSTNWASWRSRTSSWAWGSTSPTCRTMSYSTFITRWTEHPPLADSEWTSTFPLFLSFFFLSSPPST